MATLQRLCRSSVTAVCTITAACAAMSPGSARDVQHAAGRPVVSQAELQQDVQRFSTELTARITDALAPLHRSTKAEVRDAAALQVLLYGSAALEIATEAMPELALLDMIVFVSLARDVVEDHWGPKVYGAAGTPLLAAMMSSEDDIWKISAKVMDPAQRRRLAEMIAAWRAAHPEQLRVEGVRFGAFSTLAGDITEEQAEAMGGVLSGLRSAVQSADAAVLLGERAFYLANRMPFLLRLHVQVGSREVLAGAVSELGAATTMAPAFAQLEPLVRDLAVVLQATPAALREGRLLTEELRAYRKEGEPGRLDERLERIDALLDKTVRALEAVQTLAPAERGALAGGLDRMVRRWLLLGAFVGAILITLFWTGYYVAHRAGAARVATNGRSHDDDQPPSYHDHP